MMTEKQIEELQRLLADNKVFDDKTAPKLAELDRRILHQARLHVEQDKQTMVNTNQNPKRVSSFWRVHSYTAAVVLSVMLTGIMFLGLGQVISVSESDKVAFQGKIMPPITSQDERLLKPLIEKNISKTTVARAVFEESAWYAQLREQHQLEKIVLPDVAELVDVMEFELPNDSVIAQQLIQDAMQDIGAMLHQGQWQNAQLRYADLQQHCDVCTLPEDLEELLVIENFISMDSG